MIALALMLQAVPAMPLDAIGQQQMPPRGCAAFLWTDSEPHRLVAMAGSDPAELRVSIARRAVTLVRTETAGDAGFGFGSTIRYAGEGASVRLDFTVDAQPNLSAGGTVSHATLTIDRPGQDTVIVPVAGLVGCTA